MSGLRWLTPNTTLAMTLGLLGMCALIAPRLVYTASKDGGFVESGEKVNLGRWTRISAFRNGGAVLAINRPDRDPASHYESWINTGQWLRFDHVPATRRSRFVAEVRVHPAWPRDRATPVSFNVIAGVKNGPSVQSSIEPSLDQQTEWTQIALDLGPLAGHDVRIKLAPSADQEIWTLMRDPKIEVSEVTEGTE